MLTLYYSPGAASLVVHWLLIELDVAHELRRLDLAAGEQKSPEYLALNPAGVVPTLVVDGRPLTETAALVLHLADAYPAKDLAPPPGSFARGRYYEAILRCANGLQPPFRQWFYPQDGAGEPEAVKAKVRPQIESVFARFDAELAANGPYVLGDTLSAADFMLTMMMRWSRNMPRPATEWPHLAALAARMKARPSFRLLYEREGLTEWG